MILNRLVAKMIRFALTEDPIGVDCPNTVCTFKYYRDNDEDTSRFIVYFYRNVPVAFTRNDFMVDFAAIVGQTSNAYKRYLPWLKLRANQRVTVKYTANSDFTFERKELI